MSASVYPRACGVNINAAGPGRVVVGLSPRTRWNYPADEYEPHDRGISPRTRGELQGASAWTPDQKVYHQPCRWWEIIGAASGPKTLRSIPAHAGEPSPPLRHAS